MSTPSAWDDAVLAARVIALEAKAMQPAEAIAPMASCANASDLDQRPAATNERSLTGVHVLSPAGAVRERWLALLRNALPAGIPMRRLPLHASAGRVQGGLDLAASLRAGRRIAEKGLLAEADGGVVVAASAERLTQAAVAALVHALDAGAVQVERDGVGARHQARFALVALDEGIDDDAGAGASGGAGRAMTHAAERIAAALEDRLALRVDLRTITRVPREPLSMSGADDASVDILRGGVDVPAPLFDALCATAFGYGIDSTRAVLGTMRVARAIAALAGRATVDEDDATTAARLVLAGRATRMPSPPADATNDTDANGQAGDPADERPQQANDDPPDAREQQADGDRSEPPSGADADPPQPNHTQPPTNADAEPTVNGTPGDRIMAAVAAALPPGLLARIGSAPAAARRARSAAAGKAGAVRQSSTHGAPTGVRAASGGARTRERLNVIETLRAAAPWQKVRRAVANPAAGSQDGHPVGLGAVHAPDPRQPHLAPRVLVRPEDFRVTTCRQRTESTTIFVVDASGSAAHNRLAEAKGAVELLLADCYVRRDQVAVIAFRGKAAEVALPPTRSLVRAKRLLAGMPGGGGTPLAAALETAGIVAEGLARRGMTPSIVVLADGHPNVARNGVPGRREAEADARTVARTLRGSGFRTIVVDTSPRPQPFLREIADLMHGRYVPLPYASAQAVSGMVRGAGGGRPASGNGR